MRNREFQEALLHSSMRSSKSDFAELTPKDTNHNFGNATSKNVELPGTDSGIQSTFGIHGTVTASESNNITNSVDSLSCKKYNHSECPVKAAKAPVHHFNVAVTPTINLEELHTITTLLPECAEEIALLNSTDYQQSVTVLPLAWYESRQRLSMILCECMERVRILHVWQQGLVTVIYSCAKPKRHDKKLIKAQVAPVTSSALLTKQKSFTGEVPNHPTRLSSFHLQTATAEKSGSRNKVKKIHRSSNAILTPGDSKATTPNVPESRLGCSTMTTAVDGSSVISTSLCNTEVPFSLISVVC
jgi:hypothetical protein